MPKAPAARSPPKSSTKAPHRGAADASHPAVPANAEPALTPEELAIRKADDARTLLEHRRDNARYFDTARVLGPQVFADTVPLVFNSLLIILVGNIAYHTAPTGACPAGSLSVYVMGLIVASYLLTAVLGWFTLRHQVTSDIRWPFTLLLAWIAGLAAWTFVGIGAVTTAADKGCQSKTPFLFGFAVFELVVSPILAAAVVFSWFGSLLPLAWAWMRSICCGQRSVWKRWSPAG